MGVQQAEVQKMASHIDEFPVRVKKVSKRKMGQSRVLSLFPFFHSARQIV
jgi:hypothetical protein